MNIKKISDIKLDKLYIKYRDSTDPQEKLISQLAQSVIPPFHEEYYGMGKYWLKHVLARIKELRK